MKKMLVILAVLILSIGFAGCDNGTTSGGGDPKTLVITDITQAQASLGNSNLQIGIYPTGTTPSQALSETGIVAGVDQYSVDLYSDGPSGPYTCSAPLYSAPFNLVSRWTGSGTYDVYLILGYNNYYRRQNVSFTSASTTVSATTFDIVTP